MAPNQKTDQELLARLDERTLSIQKQIEQINKSLEDELATMRALKEKFVMKEEFEPIKKLIYSAIGLILSGFAAVVGSALNIGIK